MKILTIALGFIFFFSAVFAGNRIKSGESSKINILKGKVIDAATGEALTGVEIVFLGTGNSVFTDFDGEFVIRDFKSDAYALQINYISYKKKIIRGKVGSENNEITIKLVSNEPVACSKATDKYPTT
jgi:hypothetical protein